MQGLVQLLKGGPLLRPSSPARNEDGKELVRTVERLGKTIALVQVRLHLEGVDLGVRLLASGHQLPQDDAKRPLKAFLKNKCLINGQSCKRSTIVNYKSRVIK